MDAAPSTPPARMLKNDIEVDTTQSESSEYVREKLWYKLFEGLNRSVDDVYDMCEFVSGVDECDEAIKILEKGVRDMRQLRDRIKMGSSPAHSRGGIAWEERLTSPLRNSLGDILSKLRELEARVMANESSSRRSISPRSRDAASSPPAVRSSTAMSSLSMKPLTIIVAPPSPEHGDDSASAQLLCSPKSAKALHEKLSSPERRKMTSEEAERRAKEKQETAEKNRKNIDSARMERLHQQAVHFREVSRKKKKMAEDQRTRVDEKLRRAQKVRREFIKSIATKASRENSKVDDVRAETSFIEAIVTQDLGKSLQKRVEGACERQKVHIRTIVEKQKDVSKKVARANERRRKKEQRIARNQKMRLEEAQRRREELLKKKKMVKRSCTSQASSSSMSVLSWASRAALGGSTTRKKKSGRRGKPTRDRVVDLNESKGGTVGICTGDLGQVRSAKHHNVECSKVVVDSGKSKYSAVPPVDAKRQHSSGRIATSISPKRKSPRSRKSRKKEGDTSFEKGHGDSDLSIQGQKVSKLGMDSIPLSKTAKKRCREIRKRIRRRCQDLSAASTTKSASEKIETDGSKSNSWVSKRVERMLAAVNACEDTIVAKSFGDTSPRSGGCPFQELGAELRETKMSARAAATRGKGRDDVDESEFVASKAVLRNFCFGTRSGLARLVKLCSLQVAKKSPRVVARALSCCSVACDLASGGLSSPADWFMSTESGIESVFAFIELHQWAMCSVEKNCILLEEIHHLFAVILRSYSKVGAARGDDGKTSIAEASSRHGVVASDNCADLVKLLVSSGVVARLGQFLGHSASELSSGAQIRSEKRSEKSSSWSPRLLHNALALLVIISQSDCTHQSVAPTSSNCGLAKCLKDHVIESVVLLLLSFLVYGGEQKEVEAKKITSIESGGAERTLDMCRIAVVGFHALVNMAKSHTTMCQTVLGSSRLQNHFHHLLDQVFQCIERGQEDGQLQRDSDEQMLLHSLLVLLTHYCKGSVANQRTLLWGKSPTTTLERMCTLPFRYFCEAEYQSILFPALIAACFENDANTKMLAEEMDTSAIATYVERQGTNSSDDENSCSGSLEDFFPRSEWPAIRKYFS